LVLMTEAGIAANAVAFAIGVVRFRTAVLVMVFWTKSAMLLILLSTDFPGSRVDVQYIKEKEYLGVTVSRGEKMPVKPICERSDPFPQLLLVIRFFLWGLLSWMILCPFSLCNTFITAFSMIPSSISMRIFPFPATDF